ncbi:MAG: hypothetical protein GEU74_06345 [Nitriliruptorales bacterium]|nr:hypothetical protein [Nitriliruptorales bacterium]
MDDAGGHRYFEGLAVAHVLGGLDDSEGRVFRSHLLECGSCRARVGELRAIAHDLADVERDERRVRAAQAIDTKRREADEELEDAPEQVPSTRSSRVTVIIGLVLIIGLSLWNFTLRSALTVQQTIADQMRQAGVIADSGTAWDTLLAATGVEASVSHKDDRYVIAADGLKPGPHGVYVLTASGVVVRNDDLPVQEDGRVYRLFSLPESADRVVIYRATDTNGNPVPPGPEPKGHKVFEAERP